MMKSVYQIASFFAKAVISIKKGGGVILYVKSHLLLQYVILLPKTPFWSYVSRIVCESPYVP